jgi:hypothetical protein
VCYLQTVSRGPEGNFQDRLLDILRSQGLVVQKFNDLYTEGIPDTLVRLPLPMPIPSHDRLPSWIQSVWIELKAFDEWPKRETSLMPTKTKPSDGQIRWAKNFHTEAVPCWVLVNTPGGWIVADHTRIEWLWSLPISQIKQMVIKESPTMGRMMRSLYAN